MKSQPLLDLTPEALSRLGKNIVEASAQPNVSEDDDLFHAMEQRLLAEANDASKAPVAPRPLRWRVIGSALGTVSVAAGVAFAVTRPSDLNFTVRGGVVAEGDYVRQTLASAPTELTFSEGTLVEFSPGSRGRLLDVTPRGAELLLEQGHLDLQVVPRPDGDWGVAAGPFQVQVTGTIFSVEWEAHNEHLRVDVHRGSVRVKGPDADGVQVKAGQSFQAWLGPAGRRTQALAPLGADEWIHPFSLDSKTDPELGTSSAAGPSTAEVPSPGARPPSAESGTDKAVGLLPAEKSWALHVAAGNYAQVIQDAELRGVSQVLATASRTELMALADAARYSKRSDLAERTLKTIRARFPGSKDAAAAAFLLGRLVETRNPSGAMQLYLAATQEDPHGPCRGEILGRKMLLSDRTGDDAEAKRSAAEYVKSYPKGPYADKARLLTNP